MSGFPYCLIILVMSRCEVKSESEVEVCEYEDANLLFPNTPVSSASNIRAKTWNKENNIRVASWMANINFVPSPSYANRLMAIGENSIKIRNVTRSDTGMYTLVLTSGSTQAFMESTLHLEVLVPPTIHCIPKITHEGNTLMAVLPLDDCGIPSLAPSWISGIQTLIKGNISVLNFESELVPGMYTACAIGKSIRCFQGDVCKLCSNYTVLQPQNDSSSVSVIGILVLIIFYIVIGVVLALMYWKREPIQRKLFSVTARKEIVNIPIEESALTKEDTAAKELTSKVKATAGTWNKDTKLQEKIQMQQKQRHDPGSCDSRVEEGLRGIQSRKEPMQEEQRIFNKRDEKMNEEVQRIQDQLLCRICQKENACIMFLPCSHHIVCFACAQKLKNCNVCQQEIKRLVMSFAKN